MSEVPIRSGPGGPEAVRGPGEAKRASTGADDAPAFRSLLEQLEQRAAELRRHESELGGGGPLAGAVGDARASLEDALTLKDQLLEAYRASLGQDGKDTEAASE